MEQLFTNYMDEVYRYLKSRLPNIPDHVIREVTESLGYKAFMLINDIIKESNKENKEK